jgi:hypothetical protein
MTESVPPTETTAPESGVPAQQQPGGIQPPESIAPESATPAQQAVTPDETAHPTPDNVGGEIPGNPARDPIPTQESVSQGVGVAPISNNSPV